MTETVLVSTLVKYLRDGLRGFVIFKHADRFTHGVPDIAVDGNGRTSRWEVKYADPDFDSEGVQELTMLRCAAACHCARYIIFDENAGSRRTLIVLPVDFAEWKTKHIETEGFDYSWLVETIRRVHAANF